MKLRNQTFVWTGKARNVMKLSKCVLSQVSKLEGSITTLGKSQKPFQTDKEMKLAKQGTTEKYFLTLSASEIGIVVTAIVPKDEGDFDVNDITHFPTLNRLNFHFQSIHRVSPVLYSCRF